METTDDIGHLSIGEVLALLQSEFPDVTISKIRFLEAQGLIDPERTPSGYRKFYDDDLERLTQSQHHEGVCLEVLRRPPMALDAFLRGLKPGTASWLVLLDGVGNPHNFGAVLRIAPGSGRNAIDVKRVGSGLLMQTADLRDVGPADLRGVSRRAATAAEVEDLLFAWRVAKFVKSNAIVYARGLATVGIGAGQMSRVVSARIAALKAAEAGLAVAGCVMASDAFFPFRDGIDAAAAAGIRAVIQPGGSMRDAEVIAAADEHDMAMLFTGIRHFRH